MTKPKFHYDYAPGTLRAFKWPGHDDIRTHRPAEGWVVKAVAKMDDHPLTGLPLREPGEWWFVEEKE